MIGDIVVCIEYDRNITIGKKYTMLIHQKVIIIYWMVLIIDFIGVTILKLSKILEIFWKFFNIIYFIHNKIYF